jgi:phosphoribosyl 1,2-cyclic phosphodiesterase
MQVRFWGTRGSIAKPGPDTVRYGGNTSCVEVVSAAGTRLIIDCGTGAHELGQTLMAGGGALKGHVLISHTHWDHIQGIPFFGPFFVPGNEWDFYAPTGFGESLRETLAGQMEYTYFPITPEAFGATIRYHNLSEGTFRIDDIVVHTRYLNHPALTVAFRIEVDGAVVVYTCDHEPHSRDLAHAHGPLDGQDRLHAEFLRNADLVIHDAQYLAEEYAAKIGWGHSTVEYAVAIAEAVGVKRLALTHHDPTRTDAKVDALVSHAQSLLTPGGATTVFAAAEGMTLEVVGDRPASGGPPVAAILPVNAIAAPDPTVAGPAATLLLATADELLREKLLRALADEPLRPISVADADAALRHYRDQLPSVVVLDDAADERLIAALRAAGNPPSRRR